MEEMPTDEAVDVIQDLSPLKRAQVLKKLKTHTAKHLHQLSHYKENRAGGLMTTDVVTIRAEMSVKDAIENIRELSPQHASIYHLFVLNKKEILTGVVSLRTMILANPKTKIKNIMSPVVVTATLDHTQKEIATLLTKYNLLSVAIVDDQKKLLGVVTVDDIMRTLLPAA
jgi:magnesium transporter